jgi:hypothetical protein
MRYLIEDLKGHILFAHYDSWIATSEILPGLAHGIKGMQVGEKRTVYLHPTFGYGAFTTLPPCIGLKIQVHLIDFEGKYQEDVPPLTPLNFSCITDPSFFNDIQSSSEKMPGFIGSFYGRLLKRTTKAPFSEIVF